MLRCLLRNVRFTGDLAGLTAAHNVLVQALLQGSEIIAKTRSENVEKLLVSRQSRINIERGCPLRD
jgi:formyltetrahydrofolate synthetase